MTASELRINNLISITASYTGWGHIAGVTEDGVHLDDGDIIPFENVYPIPLTEEWLLKCGYVWVEEACYYADKMHCISERIGCFSFEPYCTSDSDCWVEIKYVHHLQNLYFALTGEELEVKP